jgi:vacuolar-type H+-ATPase subunit I/STV1
MSDISQLVKKITQARKIQKDRIEQAADVQTAEQESISKMTSPVVEEVAKQAAITQKAIETQHDTLKAIPHHLDNLQKMAHYKLEMDAASAPTPKRKPAKKARIQQSKDSDSDSEHFSSAGEDEPMSVLENPAWVQNLYKNSEIRETQMQQKWKLIFNKTVNLEIPAQLMFQHF